MTSAKKKGGLGAESYFENIPTLTPIENKEAQPEETKDPPTEVETLVAPVDIPLEDKPPKTASDGDQEATETHAGEEIPATVIEAPLEEQIPERVPGDVLEVPDIQPDDSEIDPEPQVSEEAAEPPQRLKIRRTYALYEETQIALEEMKLAARKQGTKTTLGDILEEAVQLLMEKKGMVQGKTSGH